MPCPDYGRVHEGFKLAYPDMGRMHPCFGHAAAMPAAAWWRMCVRDSFEFVRAGYDYDDETFDRIFRRIYSTFGSAAPYAVFPYVRAALPPVAARGRRASSSASSATPSTGTGRDVVLPALGLNQVSHALTTHACTDNDRPRTYGTCFQTTNKPR